MNNLIKREIVLDTETTGINVNDKPFIGHKIIEIGAVELIDRKITGNDFHCYLNPDRDIEIEAFKVHGISKESLFNKPRFKDVANNFFKYIKGANLVIHNAAFDIGFIDYEFQQIDFLKGSIKDFCNVIDTLSLSRKIFPGKKNNLNSLCNRYKINYTRRKHSAILDARLLTKVYLSMTKKQNAINFEKKKNKKFNILKNSINNLHIEYANKKELQLHEKYLSLLKVFHVK